MFFGEHELIIKCMKESIYPNAFDNSFIKVINKNILFINLCIPLLIVPFQTYFDIVKVRKQQLKLY